MIALISLFNKYSLNFCNLNENIQRTNILIAQKTKHRQ